MTTLVLVIHLMIATALVGVVLIQRSEGGALGIGGGGGGFMTGRGAANLLTRITAVLGAAFFATSILLAIMATQQGAPRSILESGSGQTQGPANETPSGLNKLSPLVSPPPSGPQVPQSQ